MVAKSWYQNPIPPQLQNGSCQIAFALCVLYITEICLKLKF